VAKLTPDGAAAVAGAPSIEEHDRDKRAWQKARDLNQETRKKFLPAVDRLIANQASDRDLKLIKRLADQEDTYGVACRMAVLIRSGKA
jgi:hypothetical protein